MNVEKLREELFATLSALRDKENPMDIERAKAVVQVADAITATAKVEVEHLKIVGGAGSGFIPDTRPGRLSGPQSGSPAAPLPGRSISQGK
jgi:hypothetical protein